MNRRTLLARATALAAAAAFAPRLATAKAPAKRFEVTLPESEWRKRLSPEAYRILRKHGTERPGISRLNAEKRPGTYACAGCALPLFSSKAKYDSGTGWPSFWAALPKAIGTTTDRSLFMTRVEEHCRRCGGHLGHIFDDGPPPTGKRHCINGAALRFLQAKA